MSIKILVTEYDRPRWSENEEKSFKTLILNIYELFILDVSLILASLRKSHQIKLKRLIRSFSDLIILKQNSEQSAEFKKNILWERSHMFW